MHTLASPSLPLAALAAVLRRSWPVALAEAVAAALAVLVVGPPAVDVEIAQGDRGDAVLPGEEADQLLFTDEAQANEDGSELVRLPLLLGQGLTKLLFLDQPLGNEQVVGSGEALQPLDELRLQHGNIRRRTCRLGAPRGARAS